MKQLFFGRKLALALGSNLAHKNIARSHPRADTDDASFIKIGKRPLAHIGNIARKLLTAELGFADFHVVALDMNRGKGVVFHQAMIDDDRVFEVVAVECHERDEHISTQG